VPHANTPILRPSLFLRTLRRDNSGSETIETAASSLLILLVLLGIMECSRAVYIEHFLYSAAQNASRYAMVRGSSWSGMSCTTVTTLDCEATSADVSQFVQSTAPPGMTSTNIITTTTWTGLSAAGTSCETGQGSNSPGCAVHVQITYPFKFLLPFANRSTIQLNSDATVTIAR
jgi:Flp pilus assembly protein TadG